VATEYDGSQNHKMIIVIVMYVMNHLFHSTIILSKIVSTWCNAILIWLSYFLLSNTASSD